MLADQITGESNDVQNQRALHRLTESRCRSAPPAPTRSRTAFAVATSWQSLGLHHGLLTAKHRVVFVQLALIDDDVAFEGLGVDAATLDEKVPGVLPGDALDLLLGNASFAHRVHRLRDLQRIAHAPVGGAVDDDALGTELLHEHGHAAFVHLGFGVNRMPRPTARIQHMGQGFFVVVIDQHQVFGDLALAHNIDGAQSAPLLVAGRVLSLLFMNLVFCLLPQDFHFLN